MASDQFGSGGGFSNHFNNGNATWQQALVAAYIAKGANLPDFPPTSAFPQQGRAVSELSLERLTTDYPNPPFLAPSLAHILHHLLLIRPLTSALSVKASKSMLVATSSPLVALLLPAL
jgi:hypothetical protein